MATEEEPRGDGCQVMAAERPQLLVTNLMVASAMLSCLWQISERGSVLATRQSDRSSTFCCAG